MQDLKLALRALQRRPGFTLIAALMLALGIGASTAIFSVVNGVLLKPLPYAEPERLVRVFHANPQESLEQGFSRQDWPDVRNAELPFAELAGYFYDAGRTMQNIAVGSEAARVETAYVSGSFFRMMGVAPLLGRYLTEEHDVEGAARYVLLSENLWRSQFGSARDVVGRTISVENQPYVIVGVMPRLFQYPGRAVQVWAPLALMDTTNVGGGRDFRWINALGRLQEGRTPAQARSALEPVLTRLADAYPETNRGWTTASVVPLKDDLVGEVRTALLVLLGAVGLVLLIACANLANLLLARASGRARELAVRAAMGARRGRLARQILVENITLALLGGVIGVVFSVWIVDVLVALGGDLIPRPDEVGVNPLVVLFAVAASLLTGLLASVLPAWRAGGVHPGDVLREGARGGVAAGRARARSLLVAGETALAVMLLVGALLMTRSLWHLVRTDPGFDAENVLAVGLSVSGRDVANNETLVEYRRRLLEHLRTVPGVASAGASKTLPLTGGGEPIGDDWVIVSREGARRQFAPEGGAFFISTDFFRTLGTEVLEGREFLESDRPTDATEVVPIVVNQSAAKLYWPGESPVGQYLRHPDSPARLQVVGVVEDSRTEGMTTAPPPALYMLWYYAPRNSTNILLRMKGDPAQYADEVRAAVREFDALLPVGLLEPLASLIGKDLAVPRLYAMLLGAFALSAVVLAALGLYGIIAYSVTLRGHEIGVRLALGAVRRDVVGMVVGQALRITLIGMAVGVLGAFWASRALAGMLHGVSVHDPVTFGAVPLLLVLVSLAAAALPALRAAATDPMVAFRNE